MATAAPTAEAPEKPSKLPLIAGLVLALAGAGGGFYVSYSGRLDPILGGGRAAAPAGATHGAPSAATRAGAAHGGESASPGEAAGGGGTSFVPLEPITVNLGGRSDTARHLRFAAQLEVAPGSAGAVEALMPRILDVLNIYLRALDPPELEEPAALLRLRAQMLRRVQIVTGPGLVNDLLIIEFVFN